MIKRRRATIRTRSIRWNNIRNAVTLSWNPKWIGTEMRMGDICIVTQFNTISNSIRPHQKRQIEECMLYKFVTWFQVSSLLFKWSRSFPIRFLSVFPFRYVIQTFFLIELILCDCVSFIRLIMIDSGGGNI